MCWAGKESEKSKEVNNHAQMYFLKDHKNGDTDTQHRNRGGGKTELRALKGKVYQF